MLSTFVVRTHGEPTRARMIRWMLAALGVSALHVGTAVAVAKWPRAALPAGEPPAAIMIELAPSPAAPETPPQELAVGPQIINNEEVDADDKEEVPSNQPVAKPITDAEPQTDPPKPQESAKLAEVREGEAALPAQAESLSPEQTYQEKKPALAPRPPEDRDRRTEPKAKKAVVLTTAPKPVNAPRQKTNVAPTSGTASNASIASWRGSVVAHLNRHKRYPGGGSRGTSSVAFTIDRSGRVISARLIGSSGSLALDEEAVKLAQRASPVPAPPANVSSGRGNIMLTVPIRFSSSI